MWCVWHTVHNTEGPGFSFSLLDFQYHHCASKAIETLKSSIQAAIIAYTYIIVNTAVYIVVMSSYCGHPTVVPYHREMLGNEADTQTVTTRLTFTLFKEPWYVPTIHTHTIWV